MSFTRKLVGGLIPTPNPPNIIPLLEAITKQAQATAAPLAQRGLNNVTTMFSGSDAPRTPTQDAALLQAYYALDTQRRMHRNDTLPAGRHDYKGAGPDTDPGTMVSVIGNILKDAAGKSVQGRSSANAPVEHGAGTVTGTTHQVTPIPDIVANPELRYTQPERGGPAALPVPTPVPSEPTQDAPAERGQAVPIIGVPTGTSTTGANRITPWDTDPMYAAVSRLTLEDYKKVRQAQNAGDVAETAMTQVLDAIGQTRTIDPTLRTQILAAAEQTSRDWRDQWSENRNPQLTDYYLYLTEFVNNALELADTPTATAVPSATEPNTQAQTTSGQDLFRTHLTPLKKDREQEVPAWNEGAFGDGQQGIFGIPQMYEAYRQFVETTAPNYDRSPEAFAAAIAAMHGGA